MSEYRPTEYIVDFGDYRSNQFVRLNMALIEQNSAKLGERIVRCRDCKDYRESDETCHSWQWHNWDAAIEVEPDGYCAWGERANFVICKCGEDIELGERESAVCPRCKRTVRA